MKAGVPAQSGVLVFGRNGQLAQMLAMAADASWVFAGREKVDLTDLAGVASLIRSRQWRAVINAAAYTAVDRAENEEDIVRTINALASQVMAQECARLNIHFIHWSTDYVFDGKNPAPYTENDEVCPQNVYGRTKAEAEEYILASGGRNLILRTSWIYSPVGHNFVRTMLRFADRDEVRIVNDQWGAPTAGADLAKAIVKILPQFIAGGPAGIFHITATGETNWYDFAVEIFSDACRKGLRTPAQVISIPTAEFPTPAQRPMNSRLNCEKIKQAYGITLPAWQKSLGDCLNVLLPGKVLKAGGL